MNYSSTGLAAGLRSCAYDEAAHLMRTSSPKPEAIVTSQKECKAWIDNHATHEICARVHPTGHTCVRRLKTLEEIFAQGVTVQINDEPAFVVRSGVER